MDMLQLLSNLSNISFKTAIGTCGKSILMQQHWKKGLMGQVCCLDLIVFGLLYCNEDAIEHEIRKMLKHYLKSRTNGKRSIMWRTQAIGK